MHTDTTAGPLMLPHELLPGQEVHVRVGNENLGRGRIDDMTRDGDTVWVFFGGATPRRLFIEEDGAEFRLAGPDAP